MVTAAGSLNYTNLPSALAEIARVMTEDGTFLLYDFSAGRRCTTGEHLAQWFATFEQQFPAVAGWQPIEARELPLAVHDLRLLDYTDVETQLPMSFDAYLRYVLSEVNVDNAIQRRACSAEEAHDWCHETLKAVFADGDITVAIPGYVATIGLTGRN